LALVFEVRSIAVPFPISTGVTDAFPWLKVMRSIVRYAFPQEFLEDRNCTVLHCALRAELPRRMRALTPHLVVISEPVLLDLLDACRRVRTAAPVPILVLGQSKSEDEEVLCLEYGADTYLASGASACHLHANAVALLQRGLGQVYAKTETLLVFGEVRIQVLPLIGGPYPLAPREA